MKNNKNNNKQLLVKKYNYKMYILYILIPVAIIILSRVFENNSQSSVNKGLEHNHVHENTQELKLNFPIK